MHRVLDSPAMTAPATGAAASVLAVAAVTAAIFLFKGFVPVLSLGVLYIFAVLPVAVVWGLAFALPVSVASMLAFNFFFLPPSTRSRSRRARTGSRSPSTRARRSS